MFLQENLNQKKTASFKDIRLELLEDIIIFNEQFEELKFSTCLLENELSIVNNNSEDTKAKESSMSKIGKNIKLLWDKLIAFITSFKNKIVEYFKRIIDSFKLSANVGVFNSIYFRALKIEGQDPSKTVSFIKEFDLKYIYSKLDLIFNPSFIGDGSIYREKLDKLFEDTKKYIDARKEDLAKTKKDEVNISEVVSILRKRGADFTSATGKYGNNISKNLTDLENEAKKYKDSNDTDKLNEVKQKLSIHHTIINRGLTLVMDATKLLVAYSQFK